MRPPSRRGRGGVALLLFAALGCTTPLELGERRYREGDRRGALEVWRGVGSDSLYYDAVLRRIEAVEAEFDQLVVRHKNQARYFEQRGQLAESILNYRLALELQPGDGPTLEHVQQLVRVLDASRREAERLFDESFEAGRLRQASQQLEALRTLDPFDPRLQADDRRLDEALRGKLEVLLARGRRGFTSGNHTSAERAFREVLALEPENGAAQGYLAYMASIRAEENQLRSDGAAPREPRELQASEAEIRAEGFYRNALEAERSRRPYDAIQHDLRALSLDPKHAAAQRHLLGVRQTLSSEVEPLIEKGRVYYQREELQRALDEWQRALLIQPENARAQEYVARAERLLENLEQLRAEPQVRGGDR